MLAIVKAPQQVLAEKAKFIPIKPGTLDKPTLLLIEEMKQTLAHTRDPEGVGLAAPQVGRSLQLFIAKPTDTSPVFVFVNPVIESQESDTKPTKKKSSGQNKLEGCLSLPNIWGFVKRYPRLTLSYVDEKGKAHKKKFTGFMATVIQHEIDHLNGVLFPKRVFEQNNKLYKSHKDEKGKDIFEEVEI